MAEPLYSVKMASTYDSRQKQRAVIEFLCAEKETVVKIRKRLRAVYGDAAVGRSTVRRWVRKFTASGCPESSSVDAESMISHAYAYMTRAFTTREHMLPQNVGARP